MHFVVSCELIVGNHNELNDDSHAKNKLDELAERDYIMYLFEYHILSFSSNPD